MRLPANHENWTSHHAQKAIDNAWKLFEKYESKVDLSDPASVDKWYSPYDRAKREAIDVTNTVGANCLIESARLLP
jgi:hypothetical protein